MSVYDDKSYPLSNQIISMIRAATDKRTREREREGECILGNVAYVIGGHFWCVISSLLV